MEYDTDNTGSVTLVNGTRVLLNEWGGSIAEQQVSNNRVTWTHKSIDVETAKWLFKYHDEQLRLYGIPTSRNSMYISYHYKSLFHALEAAYEQSSDLMKWNGIFFHNSTVQLTIGDHIQHCVDMAIQGGHVGACPNCKELVFLKSVAGWQVSVPVDPEVIRIHKRYGEPSVALNPICDKCYDEKMFNK